MTGRPGRTSAGVPGQVRPNGVMILGLALLAALILLALVPSWVSPYDPRERVGRPLARPSGQFWLGTNDIGQDLLSELIWGTRATLVVGLVVGILAVSTGTVVGLVSGYVTSWPGDLLMRVADLTLVLPFLPLVILLSAYVGPGERNVILILTLVFWAGPARVIRAQVLSIRHESYVEAAHAMGCSPVRILFGHIWPGVRTLAVAQLVLVSSAGMLAEASLSFLGLGDPASKSWGTMLYFARASGAFLGSAWLWWVVPTGLMITLAVLSLALIGYGLERHLEPTLYGG